MEADHWWFVGRRRLFGRLIAGLELDSAATVVDIGCGTGGNLRLLRALGFDDVSGVDASPVALAYCRDKGLPPVRLGDIRALPFATGSVALALVTDVVEHVDEDAQALAEVARVLCPGGAALITVPAFSALWGLQDEISHHKRRYRKPEIVAKIAGAGLKIERAFYFNYLLFAPIWVARTVMRRLRPRLRSENELNTPLLNFALGLLFAVDVATAPYLSPPFGVSALVLARKPKS